MTLLEARTRYFEANGFGDDGGYSDKWVKIVLFGKLPVHIPNTPGRVRAVRYHDLHHVVTGYSTDMHGEAQISAWELASNCKREYAAWLLNAGGLLYGLITTPGDMFRAWVRGRHSENLYGRRFDDALLGERVEPMRRELRLDRAARPSFADVLTFGLASLAAALPLLLVVGLLGWLILALIG
ncbi:hypothetical protein ACNOYE_08860 [Nannocystaceae bacterium ST9]